MATNTADPPFAVRPLIFDLADGKDYAELEGLRASGAIWREHDTLREQLDGLLESREPSLRSLSSAARAGVLDSARAQHLDSQPIEEYGRWVLYPWSGQLVHLLAPSEFDELRLDRNRNKLSREEQARLRQVTVGVVGLSVGNAVALNLALEGACGHLVLADFDALELSNMNRIRAATHTLGLPKVVLAARQLSELDPYLRVTLFPEGLNRENLDEFFLGGTPLDVVVDECDAIDVKFLLREKARKLALPVLMETSDRSLLDVERFDLEPARPLFHGRVDELSASSLRSLSADDKLRYILQIVGADVISPSMAASLIEVEHTLSTWPQLGSDVMLGGASVTQAVRRIALGKPLESGRRALDLDAALDRLEVSSAPESRPQIPNTLRSRQELDPLIADMLTEATLAPSGGNTQPWCFEVDGACVNVCLNGRRETGLLDVQNIASRLALGAVVDILAIGAAARSRHARITYQPNSERPEVVARVDVIEGTTPEDLSLKALHPLVTARHTNRRTVPSSPLRVEERAALDESISAFDARIDWIEGRASLAELAEVIAEGDRIRMLHPGLNADLKRELSFEPASEVLDAISIDTVEASELDRVAYQLMLRPEVALRVKETGGGDRLLDRSRREVTNAAAVGVLTASSEAPKTLLEAGRAMHRVWLEATRLGLGFQPVGVLPYMVRLTEAPDVCSFDHDDVATLRELEAALRGINPALSERPLLMVFRVHRSPLASARSLRIPIEAVVKTSAKERS